MTNMQASTHSNRRQAETHSQAIQDAYAGKQRLKDSQAKLTDRQEKTHRQARKDSKVGKQRLRGRQAKTPR